jgi:hypothetical protein
MRATVKCHAAMMKVVDAAAQYGDQICLGRGKEAKIGHLRNGQFDSLKIVAPHRTDLSGLDTKIYGARRG